MFKRIFGSKGDSSSGGGSGTSSAQNKALNALDKLRDSLSNLEKREKLISKKIEAELNQAKEYTKQKNKRAALQCLKRKKMFEQQLEQLENQKWKVEEQINMLEGANTMTNVVGALKEGAGAMVSIKKETNIDKVDKVMDDINESMEDFKMINDALAQPSGMMADIDEDELLADLNELEELENDTELLAEPTLPSAPTTVPAAKAPAVAAAPQAAAVSAASKQEADELAELEAEMQMLAA